jgi:hypothetical protein
MRGRRKQVGCSFQVTDRSFGHQQQRSRVRWDDAGSKASYGH